MSIVININTKSTIRDHNIAYLPSIEPTGVSASRITIIRDIYTLIPTMLANMPKPTLHLATLGLLTLIPSVISQAVPSFHREVQWQPENSRQRACSGPNLIDYTGRDTMLFRAN